MRVYLLDTSNSENEITNVLSGAPFGWVADDTLDSATIRYTSSSKEPLKPAQVVRIKFDDSNSQDLLIAGDSVEPFDKRGTYLHTLSLVELTKILEKLFVNSFVSRADNGITLNVQIQRAGHNLYAIIGKENKIIIDQTIVTKTTNYASQDFNLQNATAREVFDEMLSACDCRVVVLSVLWNSGVREIRIGYIDNNALTPKTITTPVGSYANNNVDNYNGKIVSVTSNATPQKLLKQTDTFKASGTTSTTKNRVIQFAYNPEYVTEFYIVARTGKTIDVNCWVTGGGTSQQQINIGDKKVPLINSYNGTAYQDLFIDKEYWDTLGNVPASPAQGRPLDWPYGDDIYKENTLYYERNNDVADISKTYKTMFTSQTHFANAMIKAYNRYILLHPELVPSGYTLNYVNESSWNYDDFYFEMTYAPLIDTMVEVTKGYSDADKGLCVIDGQSASTLDLARYGRNLLGKAQRIGNNDYIIDTNETSFTSILEPLDYITDNGKKLVVYKTEFSVLPNLYKVRYTLTENYNNLSERVALAREKRIYEIPLTGYKTIIPIREQVTYTNETNSTTPSITSGDEDVCNSVIAFIGETLTEQNNLKPIENMLVTTQGIVSNHGAFCLPVVGFGCGNTINFVAKFYDNYSAGLSVSDNHSIFDWVGGKKVVYNPYVDNDGKLYGLTNIKLANSKNISATSISARPKTGSGETFKEFSNEGTITYFKDASESLQLQKIYNFVGSGAVITPLTLEDNNAFFGGSRTLKLYQNCTYTQGQTIRTDGTEVGRAGTYLNGAVGKEGNKYSYFISSNTEYNNAIICDTNNRIYAYIPQISTTKKLILRDERIY